MKQQQMFFFFLSILILNSNSILVSQKANNDETESFISTTNKNDFETSSINVNDNFNKYNLSRENKEPIPINQINLLSNNNNNLNSKTNLLGSVTDNSKILSNEKKKNLNIKSKHKDDSIIKDENNLNKKVKISDLELINSTTTEQKRIKTSMFEIQSNPSNSYCNVSNCSKCVLKSDDSSNDDSIDFSNDINNLDNSNNISNSDDSNFNNKRIREGKKIQSKEKNKKTNKTIKKSYLKGSLNKLKQSDPNCKDNLNTNLQYICSECGIGFVLHNNKCLDFEKLQTYLNYLIANLGDDQQKLMNIVSKKILNPDISSRLSITNFTEFKELLEKLKKNTARECQKKINAFIVTFEENIQSLIDISNLIETKNEVKLRQISNKILSFVDLLKSNNDVSVESNETLKSYFDELNTVLTSSFANIEAKISNYEALSMKKLISLQNSFRVKINYLSPN